MIQGPPLQMAPGVLCVIGAGIIRPCFSCRMKWRSTGHTGRSLSISGGSIAGSRRDRQPYSLRCRTSQNHSSAKVIPVDHIEIILRTILSKWTIPTGNEFKKMRVGLGMSVEEVALLSGIPETTVYKFERGIRPHGIHSENLRRMIGAMREHCEIVELPLSEEKPGAP